MNSAQLTSGKLHAIASPPDMAAAVAPRMLMSDVSLVYQASRGPLKALDSVAFSVREGEFVSILGPSGCGKSTLLRLVSGLVKPSSGTIRIAGGPVVGTRRDIGMVFQQPTLLPWKTILDNVLAPIRAMGGDVASYRARALDLLALVGLRDFSDHYPSELSGGMQQRVGIARCLIHDPSMLLMDEPFAALDAMTREHMMVELQRIWMTTGKSVMFVTHSIPEAVFLSDRIVVLSGRPGRVVHDVRVDLARPRRLEAMATAAFGDLTDRLRRDFADLTTVQEQCACSGD